MDPIVPVGSGSYTTRLPAGDKVPSDVNNNPVTPKVTSDFSQIPLSNKWWSSLIWQFQPNNPWSENLYAHPLSYRALARGMQIGYPSIPAITPDTISPTGGHKLQEYHYDHIPDLTLSVGTLNSPDTRVAAYTDWTVTAAWADQNDSLKMTIGSGLPFAYCTKTGGPLTINVIATPTIWYNQNGVIGLTVNNHHYGLFAPTGSRWTLNDTLLQSDLNGKDYFSLAILPNNSFATLEFYRQHAYAFVTNTTVNWNFNEQNSKLTTTFNVQTTLKESGNNNVNQPLITLYRHQWLHTDTPLTPYTYVSPRGTIKVFDGPEFTTQMTFNGTLPGLPHVAVNGKDTYSSTQLYNYVDSIYRQDHINRWNGVVNNDTYGVGKQLGRLSLVTRIADQVNHTAARDLFLSEIKTTLQAWFVATNAADLFYYNNDWKTLIGYPAGFGSDTQMNDHHFHYGYFIAAAALVAQYDQSWAAQSQWGAMVELLIKDANNWDKADNRFPFLRYFDSFRGHGWANGAAAFGAGNNQESSSEAMNFANAVILWGALTGNKKIRDLGIYLYTTESEAIKQYWFDVDRQVFPQGFTKPTLGIVWGNGGSYAIWWPGMVEELHGINFLPITGGSLYLGHYPDYLQTNERFMEGNSNGHDNWTDIHMAVKALYNPLLAINTFNNNPNYTQEHGESRAHTYHWIHNLNTLGRVNTQITSNYPISAVFTKNNINTYVAYNATPQPITVSFSNGNSLSVAPYAYATASR